MINAQVMRYTYNTRLILNKLLYPIAKKEKDPIICFVNVRSKFGTTRKRISTTCCIFDFDFQISYSEETMSNINFCTMTAGVREKPWCIAPGHFTFAIISVGIEVTGKGDCALTIYQR